MSFRILVLVRFMVAIYSHPLTGAQPRASSGPRSFRVSGGF